MVEPGSPAAGQKGVHAALLLLALALFVLCLALRLPSLASGFQLSLVLYPLVFHLASLNSLIFLQTLSAYLRGFRAMNFYALTLDPLLGPFRDVRRISPPPSRGRTCWATAITEQITSPRPARTRRSAPMKSASWLPPHSGSGRPGSTSRTPLASTPAPNPSTYSSFNVLSNHVLGSKPFGALRLGKDGVPLLSGRVIASRISVIVLPFLY